MKWKLRIQRKKLWFADSKRKLAVDSEDVKVESKLQMWDAEGLLLMQLIRGKAITVVEDDPRDLEIPGL